MKRAVEKKYGPHNFNKRSRGLINSILKNNLIEVPDLPDHDSNFLYSSPAEVKDVSRDTFLYGEYIKRKFFLDCKFKKKDNKFIYNEDKRKSYISENYNDLNACIDSISSKFFVSEEERRDFYSSINFDKNFIKELCSSNFDIYCSILNCFYFHINEIKRILQSYLATHPDFTLNILNQNKKDLDIYLYERCLYFYTSKTFFNSSHNTYRDFDKISSILSKHWYCFSSSFLKLYRSIIDNYCIFMTDLYKFSDCKKIISNGYNIDGISNFFFIPREPVDTFPNDRYFDLSLNFTKHTLTLSIDLSNNFDILDLTSFVHDSLLYALYNYKIVSGKSYSTNELSYFINKFNFKKGYIKDRFSERIIGLCLWDQIYLENNTDDISFLCKRLYNQYLCGKDQNTFETVKQHLKRCYSTVRKDIEKVNTMI